MKKVLLALLALSLLLVCSCKKDKGPSETPKDPAALEVPNKAFNAEKGDGTIEIPISANYNTIRVSIASDATTWLYSNGTKSETKAEMKNYTVSIGYRANPLAKVREGNVTITLDNVSEVVKITQAAGDPTISVGLESAKINPKGMTLLVPVESNDEVVFSSEARWATVKETKENGIVVDFALNDTGEERSAELVFATKSDANIKGVVTVTQKAANVDPTAISILSFGNNASTDAMAYLYPVLEKLGYTNIRLGNLYKSDTKLEEHVALIPNTEKVYTYAYTTDGTWETTDTTAVDLLTPEDWDFIVLQENNDNAGLPYTSLADVVSAIRQICTFTPIAWDIAWAPQGEGQQEAFEAIINAVESSVKTNSEISVIIPAGTAVQNLRTSFFEDNINKSAKELSLNIGRQTATLAWAKALTGKDIKDAMFYPVTETETEGVVNKEDTYQYESDYVPAIVEAVNNAVEKPFVVTETTEFAPRVSGIDQASAQAAILAAGKNVSDYVEIPLPLVHNAYWNSTSSYNINVAWAGAKGETLNKFVATKKIAKSVIPVGSLIVVLGDFQYRPEGWQSASANNNKARPDNVSESVVEVTYDWWNASGFTYRAFNISKKDGTVFTDADFVAAAKSFAIFIPKTSVSGGLEDYNQGGFNW